MDDTTIRTFTVVRARGVGVEVTIWEAEIDEAGGGTRHEVTKRPARTWAEMAALGAEYGVPEEHWQVDDDAMELLGPEPPQAPDETP